MHEGAGMRGTIQYINIYQIPNIIIMRHRKQQAPPQHKYPTRQSRRPSTLNKEQDKSQPTRVRVSQSRNRERAQDQHIDKREALRSKKEQKFKETIEKCSRHMLHGASQRAILPLKNSIEQDDSFWEVYEFKAYGHPENWKGYYAGGMTMFYTKATEQEQVLNPFDLLALCLIDQFEKHKLDSDYWYGWYQKMLDKYPNKPELMIGLAGLYYADYYYLKAQDLYHRVLPLTLCKEKTYQYLGWVEGYMFERDPIAIQWCEKALEINPQSIYAQYLIALCQQKTPQKLEKLTQLSQKHPQYYRVYIDIQSFTKNESIQQECIKKALERDPSYVYIYLRTADILETQDKIPEMFAKYKEATQIDPYDSFVDLYQAIYHKNVHNHYQAQRFYKSTLEKCPRNLDGIKSYALFLKDEQGDIDKAVELLSEYVILNPYSEEVYNYLGLFYDSREQKDEAMQFYRKSIENNPKYHEAYVNLAVSYQQYIEDHQKAIEYYEKASELEPNQGDILYGIGLNYSMIKRYELAIEYCHRALKKECTTSTRIEIYEVLSESFREQKMYKQAIESCLRIVMIKKRTITKQIGKNLLNHIDKHIATEILIKLAKQTHQTKPLYFMQIGKMLMWIQDTQHIEEIIEIVKSKVTTEEDDESYHANEDQEEEEEIDEEEDEEMEPDEWIDNFEGRQEEWKEKKQQGYHCYRQKLKFEKILQEFQQKYRAVYQ